MVRGLLAGAAEWPPLGLFELLDELPQAVSPAVSRANAAPPRSVMSRLSTCLSSHSTQRQLASYSASQKVGFHCRRKDVVLSTRQHNVAAAASPLKSSTEARRSDGSTARCRGSASSRTSGGAVRSSVRAVRARLTGAGMSHARVAVLGIVFKQLSVTAAAANYGFSRRHLQRLLARYREGGLDALEPRSRRAKSTPIATPENVGRRVLLSWDRS